MSTELRILLIIVSVITFYLCIKKMKQAKLKTTDSVIWMIGSAILILMSVFDQAVGWIACKLGFMAPVNFVFFMVIGFLLVLVFLESVKIHTLEEKIKDMDHYLGLKDYAEKHEEK